MSPSKDHGNREPWSNFPYSQTGPDIERALPVGFLDEHRLLVNLAGPTDHEVSSYQLDTDIHYENGPVRQINLGHLYDHFLTIGRNVEMLPLRGSARKEIPKPQTRSGSGVFRSQASAADVESIRTLELTDFDRGFLPRDSGARDVLFQESSKPYPKADIPPNSCSKYYHKYHAILLI